MNFEKFQAEKDKLEKLPNVSFYSFHENTVIVENKKNKALYQIPFTQESDDSITLHLGAGKQVKNGVPTLEEQFNNHKQTIVYGIKKIFSNYDEGIMEVKKAIANTPNIDMNDIYKSQPKKVNYAQKIDKYCESKIKPVKNINTKFRDKIISCYQDEKDFISLFNIFNEDNTLKTYDFNFDLLKSQYTETKNEYERFCTKLGKMNQFVETVSKIVDDDTFAQDIIEKIDFEDNMKISIPKAVVIAQQSYGENVNVVDITKKISKAYTEVFDSEEENPVIFNRHRSNSDNNLPKFLKFNTGKYNRGDVETLEHELEQAFYLLPDITDEDIRQIGQWKNECTYMSRTGYISDKKVDEIIRSFNSKYADSTTDNFNDGDMAVGYRKGPEEMKDMAGGDLEFARNEDGSSDVDDSEIEVDEQPMEDDEEEEKIADVK